MRIAFTSCASARLIRRQRVWDDIAAAAPQVLVLLGDNTYCDVPDTSISELQDMSDLQFAEHLMQRYCEQLSDSAFMRIVGNAAITKYAIWDDHDFLWNDAAGGDLFANPHHQGKIEIAASLLRAFRQALAQHDVHAFPTSTSDARVWQDWQLHSAYAPPGLTSLPLEADGRSVLHLTDGRSWRKAGQTLLGTAQRAQLQAAFAAKPQALHVIASGSSYRQGNENWLGAGQDAAWLHTQLQGQRGLMLSGDIHQNALADHALPGGGHLLEAVASGAALRANLNGLWGGAELRNFGLLDLSADRASVQVLSFNQPTAGLPALAFAREVDGRLRAL